MKGHEFDTSDPFLSPTQVAALLGIAVSTVRQAMRHGTMPSVKVGRLLRIRSSEFQAYLNTLPKTVQTTRPTETTNNGGTA